MKNLKSKFKKTALAVVIASAGLLGVSNTASAYEGDPWFHAWEGYEWIPFLDMYYEFVAEVDNQFFAINTYLSEIYAYLTKGEGETGKGIIGVMGKIWQEQREFQETTMKNQAQMNRVTQTDAAVSNRIAKNMPNPRNCSEIPRVMGARMAGGGGRGGRASKGMIEKVVANNAAGTAPSSTAQAGEVYGTHAQAKYCSKADITYTNGQTHAAFGCTAASTTMPDGDSRVQSLFVPAHDFETPSKALEANLTFSEPDHIQASADSAKTLVASFSPIGLTKDVETTPDGKTYLSKVKVFNARVSPAVHALAQIASMRIPDKNLPQFLSDGWKGTAGPVYSRIFPGMKLPDQPSDAEVMRFEVVRRFADFGPDSWYQKLLDDDDETNQVRELNSTQAVALYLNWQIHNRLEENNAIQAAILAQLVNPVTKADMDTAAKAVYSNKK